jgi:hypothetical protein
MKGRMLVIYYVFVCIETASIVAAKCISPACRFFFSDVACEDATSLHSAVHLTCGCAGGGRHTNRAYLACAGASFQKQARKQVDDVGYLAASEQQIVYTCLRPRIAIDNPQHGIISQRDNLASHHIPSPISPQCFPQRQFHYALYPAHRARSDVQHRGDCMRQTTISARRKR